MRRALSGVAAATVLLAGCASQNDGQSSEPGDGAAELKQELGADFDVVERAQLDAPWAIEFLPSSDLLLITERTGALQLHDQSTGETHEVAGVPEVDDSGQGGMHDVITSPEFEDDQTIYLSWVRSTDAGSQGVVGRAHLDTDDLRLQDLEVLWEQDPATGDGHFSLRMIIMDGLLYLSSGDRQELDPAQDLDTNLGKILRLTLDGKPAAGNPFADHGSPSDELWSIGHRNALGLDTDSQGNLWSSEMGPEGGDELNLIREGANYGWPEVSMGTHYDGTEIPDHAPDDDFEAPKAHWVPAISPANLLIYQGELFDDWQDSALLGGLSGETLVRVELHGEDAQPVEHWDAGERLRAVEEAPNGAIWIATDAGALTELRPGSN